MVVAQNGVACATGVGEVGLGLVPEGVLRRKIPGEHPNDDDEHPMVMRMED